MKPIDKLMEEINSPRTSRNVHVDVLRGSTAFSRACRVSAITLGLIACAQIASVTDTLPGSGPASPTGPASSVGSVSALQKAPIIAGTVTAPNAAPNTVLVHSRQPRLSTSADIPLIDRTATPLTPALLSLVKMLPDQKQKAEMISQEQMQVLRYGEHPPVKTTVRINGKMETQWTLHPFDVVRLAREAAAKASVLEGIRVDPNKVGAVMIAESAMVSRVGWSSNGKTPSFGLAQLEERTAKSLGVSDLNDPRQSAFAAARLVAEGQKLANVNRSVDASLITSLSYNTSSATRKMLIAQYGSSLRIEHLPSATQAHVKNMAYGEQRMSLFSKLRDQHEKSISASIEAAPPALSTPSAAPTAAAAPAARTATTPPVSPVPTAAVRTAQTTALPQESTMNKPRPSTRSLVSNIASDSSNQIRLVNNQLALERAGHIQTVPMTSRGLNELRQAISVNVLRASDAGNPSGLSRDLHTAPAAVLLSSVGQPMQSVVNSLMTKAHEAYEAISEKFKAVFDVVSDGPAATRARLAFEQRNAEMTVQQTSLSMHEIREEAERQERINAQAHPAFIQEQQHAASI